MDQQHFINTFTTIPLDDIYFTLYNSNIQILPNNQDNYQNVLGLISADKLQQVPIPIADWIIAWNVFNNNNNIPIVSSSQILLGSDQELLPLAKSLMLDTVDKERMIRILKYLGNYTEDLLFEQMPPELLLLTLEYVDCKDIMLMVKVSPQFKKLYDSGQLLQFMRVLVNKRSGLNVDNFTLPELIRTCKATGTQYIKAGMQYSFVLTREGKVYGFGSNFAYELGLGDNINRYIPTLIPNLNNIVSISCGNSHTLALDNQGFVYGFGSTYYGQLGLGFADYNTPQKTPVLIPGLRNIKAIACGYDHSLVLDIEGKVYSFGNNEDGQLGLNNNIMKTTPTLITNIPVINKIFAGDLCSMILDNNGNVYVFGNNNFGQLGLGDYKNRYVPTLITGLNSIVSVSIGYQYQYTLFLNSDGQVFICGSNLSRQLPLDDVDEINYPINLPGLQNIIAISAGSNHSLFLNKYGNVYGLGINNRGQLGHEFIVILKSLDIPMFKPGVFSSTSSPVNIGILRNIFQISAGSDYSLVLDDDGNIFAFGNNGYVNNMGENVLIGNLGIENEMFVVTPTIIPNFKI